MSVGDCDCDCAGDDEDGDGDADADADGDGATRLVGEAAIECCRCGCTGTAAAIVFVVLMVDTGICLLVP